MRREESGFTLIEVTVGMVVLAVGVLGLAGGLALGARRLTGTQDQLLASQRAAEAAESVFKARDNGSLTWAQIRNVLGGTGTDGGVFLDGPQQVKLVGPDGLTNTADDGAVEQLVKPGADGLLGTSDDVSTPLHGFTREVEIRDLTATLRQLRVIVRYRVGTSTTTYVLVTYVSAYA
jgi:prepilin-type N-terminal cleavage/methylation domain-containing protein